MGNEIYISYAWKGESEATVNAICAALRGRFLEYQRDKEAMNYRDSIRAFMEAIGRGKFIVAVISDKYLKSEYCMYEAMRMMQGGEHERRVFPIVLGDADVYTPKGQLAYLKHWKETASQLQQEIRELDDPALTVEISSRLRDIEETKLYINRFMAFLSDKNLLALEMHRDAGYSQLIAAIEAEMAAQDAAAPIARAGGPRPYDAIPDPAPLPPGSRLPISPNPLFTGRADEFRELAASLLAGRGIAITTGMGGVGKTQLAAEFAHRYGGHFAGGVFWISMADPASIEAEIASCAKSAGWADASLPLEAQVAAARKAWAEALPRLLIFDNCEDPALITMWRPAHGGARLLVTSRQQDWDPALSVSTLPLHTLPRSESIALLRKFRPELAEDDPILNQIARELGDLPLALHLAGSFLNKYHGAVSPAAYLAQLKSSSLLNHPSMQGRGAGVAPTDHIMHVGRTFALSLDRLNPDNETDAFALALLARAAYFAPGEPIPRDLLKLTATLTPGPGPSPFQGEGSNELLLEDTLLTLTALGLLEGETGGALKMHRLVAEFVMSQNTEDHDHSLPLQIAELAMDNGYYFNANGVLTAISAIAISNEANIKKIYLLGRFYYGIEKIQEAKSKFDQCLQLIKEFKTSTVIEKAKVLRSLGLAYRDLDDEIHAREFTNDALEIYLAEADPNGFIECLITLIQIEYNSGDYDKAREYYSDGEKWIRTYKLGKKIQGDLNYVYAKVLLDSDDKEKLNEGLQLAELALKFSPYEKKKIQARVLVGHFYRKLKNFRRTLEIARKNEKKIWKLRKETENPSAFVTLAVTNSANLVLALVGLKKCPEALEEWEQIREIAKIKEPDWHEFVENSLSENCKD